MGLSLRKSGNLPTSISINNSTSFSIFSSGERYLMDLYGIATAAYSLRKLRRKYTGPAIRARKQVNSSDVYEEIGFDSSGNLDTTSLTTFASNADNGDVFVQTWYDQSGNNNHATQITHTSQPKIVNAGALVTENSKVGIDFSAHSLATASPISLTNQSIFAAIKLDTTITAASSDQRLWLNDASSSDLFTFGASTSTLTNERLSWLRASGVNVYGSGQTSNDISSGQYLYSALFNTSPSTAIYQNGTALSLTPTSGGGGAGAFTNTIYPQGFQRIGASSTGIAPFDGKVHEIIIYNSDKSALRTQIEANINGYYNIYTP